MHFAPKDNVKKWDQIVSHMNWYLHAEGVWERPYENFFDGAECKDAYKYYVGSLFANSKKTLDRPFTSELKNIADETGNVCGSL